MSMAGHIVSLHKSPLHEFVKAKASSLRLLAGLGVEGDAHCGETVQHRSRVAVDPTQPNLRQVHLLHTELLRELQEEGFAVGPGLIGENVLTEGIDLLGLPCATRLRLGSQAEIELTGLRNPCKQLHQIDPALLTRLARRERSGKLTRLAGVMAIVLREGEIQVGDPIEIRLPSVTHEPLAPV